MKDVMSAVLTRRDVRRLASERDGLVVSFFLPMRQDAYERSENSDRLKTLFYRARRMLADHGLSAGDVERFLWPVRSVIEDASFWGRRADGLALFVWDSKFEAFRLGHTVGERVNVGQAAVITPLLPTLAAPERFYVLGLSRNLIRLWRCERGETTKVNVEAFGIPKDLAETLRFDDYSRQLQSHATSRSGPVFRDHRGSSRTGKRMWHGHGFGGEEDKEHLTRFLHEVDVGVRRAIAGAPGPLILAGVGYEVARYRSVTNEGGLLSETLEGNPDRLRTSDVAAAGMPIAMRSPGAPIRSAVSLYEIARGQDRTLTDLRKIVPAAAAGSIEVLLLKSGDPVWGIFDPISSDVDIHGVWRVGSVDLCDLVVRTTLGHGGDAFLLSSDEMPENGVFAAILHH